MKKFIITIVMMFSFSAAFATEDEEGVLRQFQADQSLAQAGDESPLTFSDEGAQPAVKQVEKVELEPAPINQSASNTEDELDRPALREADKKAKKKESRKVADKAPKQAPYTSPVSAGVRMSVGGGASTNIATSVPGLTLSNEGDQPIEIFAEWREGQMGFELAMTTGDGSSHELSAFGSSLGRLTLNGPSWIISAKRYAFEQDWVHPYVGIGFSETKVDGAFAMGGIPFEMDGDGWHFVGRLGAEFPVWQLINLTAEYRFQQAEIQAVIPSGGGKASIEVNDQLLVGVVAHF